MRFGLTGFLAALVAALLSGAAVAAEGGGAAAAGRPNVLLVMCDDLCCALGCYGDGTALTPNIDRLAARGVRFERAYCQYPLCNPSRASMLTGRRPSRTRVVDNRLHFRDVDAGAVSLPEAFRRDGFRVERIGKLYHYGVPGQIGTDGLDDPASWDAVFNPRGRDKTDEADVFTLEPGKYGGTVSWLAAEGGDEEQTDGLGAARACERLEAFAREGTPFFLAVGFFRPHTPYVAPRAWFDRHPVGAVALPAVPDGHDAAIPPGAVASRKPEQERLRGDLGREAIRAYRAAVSFVDAQVGKVLDALDRTGLADDTIVVFASDHGYHLGEHDLWQKMSLFEQSARVPLVVALPPRFAGAAAGGTVCARTVELVDVMPTLCDLAGVPLPEGTCDGRSLAPVLLPREGEPLEDRPAITEVRHGAKLRGASVRTARYRYTEWNGGAAGRQLYDHDADPAELSNLSERPEHAATVAELAGHLAGKVGGDAAPAAERPASRARNAKPNVMVILADDLGFSDIGAYGGEIDTPNLDRLARGGLRFTQATNTARCWPSRAALLTGFYPQSIRRDALPAGDGRDALAGGGQGKRPEWARLLPELLAPAGYRSYHSGKWHVDGQPLEQGFHRSLDVNGTGQSNFFDPSGVTVEGKPLPESPGYYATGAIGDHAVACLRDHVVNCPEKPFFHYVAFTAPHFPLQAPEALVAKYRDRYLAGWESIRASRHDRQLRERIVTGRLSPVERDVGPPYPFPEALAVLGPGEVDRPLPWDSLTDEQRRFQATKMAIHAAMIEAMDREIGRIVGQLEASKRLDDTLLLFASDNGASAEIMVRGEGHDPEAPPGSRKSFLCLGPGWSSAANTPFRRHKTWVHEGGIATPWIVHWPAGLPEGAAGALRHQPVHLIDVAPTVLELAGTAQPALLADGTPVPPMQGRSLARVLADAAAPAPHEALWWCHEGHRAVRVGDKKLVAAKGEPWSLHDLFADRAEAVDLAARQPDAVVALERKWLAIADECRALSTGDWKEKEAEPAASATTRPPNVVVVFADDLGWGDPACYGGRAAPTPHLDRLAREGVRFTDFHVAQAVCSASRAALLTGCYPNRVGIAGALGPNARQGLSADETTLAELLRARGYRTGAVGKWHLGHHAPFLPTRHGFDEWLGLPYSNDMWPHHPEAAPGTYPALPLFDGDSVVDPEVTPDDQRSLTARYAARAVDFIERAGGDDRPFFLYLAHSMPHVPLFAGADFAGTTPGGPYGDVLAEIDASVGAILAALERTGHLDDTLVLFTSDNGPWLSYGDHAGATGGFREGKGTVFEGGVRVPCLARLPGTIPQGSVCAAPAMTIDLFPTIAALAGAALETAPSGALVAGGRVIDGRDIGGLLRGDPAAAEAQRHRDYGFWYLDNELQAVRRGRHKLFFPHVARTMEGQAPGADGVPGKYRPLPVPRMLVDLESDPGETTDVSAEHPDVVAALEGVAERFRADLGDRLTGRQGSGVRPAGRLPEGEGAAAPQVSPAVGAAGARPASARPNVILVMTDDQGYGDVAAHGNPILRTPHLDRLWREGVRFTEWHASPTCAPTRAALLTGRHEFRSGVTHTIHERERLALSATTLPQLLRASGYATGLFGKWHLGDEEAYQPGKRGFERSVIHGAGGIGQSYPGSCGDVPGNRYLDPVLREDGLFVKRRGYCTDLFFDAAGKWIEEVAAAAPRRPFFCMITPNAPHDPLDCPEGSDAGPEARMEAAGLLDVAGRARVARFHGMIENIDTNVGRLLDRLDRAGIAGDTLVIFTTDNGTASGAGVWNDSMRGTKGTPWRGGTRVPSFWRWPGRLASGVDVRAPVAHVDLLPTLCELCGVAIPADLAPRIEGRSLVPLLHDPHAPWGDRTLFTHLGRWERGGAAGAKFAQCRVRRGAMSLVNVTGRADGWQLHDVEADPGESHDLAAERPETVRALVGEYDRWWDSIAADLVNEDLDGPAENPFKTAFERQFGAGATAATIPFP